MTQLALVEPTEDLALVRRVVVLPFLPPSKNRYESWQPQWRASARAKWYRALETQFAELQFPIGAAKVGLAIRLTFASNRRRDWQNYAPLLLHVVPDALVRAGVIADDTPEYFEVGPNAGITFALDTRQAVHSSLRQRTELSFAIRV